MQMASLEGIKFHGEAVESDHYYSTRELSKLLRVNESTVKRWADRGDFTCFRTPGGHRKFTPKHVLEFVSKYDYELISEVSHLRKKV